MFIHLYLVKNKENFTFTDTLLEHLSIVIQRMWNMKCFVIPVIIGATGIVSKGLKNIWKQYQESIQ